MSLEAGDYESMAESAKAASDLLRALAHEARLMILCMLVEGEKSVSELEAFLDMRQPTVSQQLARLRADRLVKTRREGKTIYYSLASENAQKVVDLLYDLYCRNNAECP
ncbi:MAG: metalloregulator ArsR/SmtB family transcription factor [Methyloligellaceae bacterium]